MRLVRCHIENFGKLQNFDYEFDAGLNTIKQVNGFGKTTFAHFIKAMFYGLPSTTKKNISQNIRKKYTPWQGGIFGGYIEVEIEEKIYRVERFFGVKESEDVFKMIDLSTGKIAQNYTSSLGEELFGVDADGYERSTYIPEEKLENKTNESLQNRLTSVLQGSDNRESLEVAIQVLEKKKAELKNKQNKGIIPKLEEKIDLLNSEIDRLKSQYVEVENLNKELKNHYERLAVLKEKQNEIKQNIKDYSSVQRKLESQKHIEENTKKLQSYQKNIIKNDEILNNNEDFVKKVDEYQQMNNKKDELKTKINVIKETSRLEKEKNILDEYFKRQKPEKEQLDNLIEKEKKLRTNVGLEKTKPASRIPLIVLLSLVVSFLIVGSVLISKYLTVGIILFGLAFISLCLAGFMYIKRYIEVKTGGLLTNHNASDNSLKQEIELFIKATKETAVEQSLALNNIKSKLEQYERICEELEKQQIMLNELNKEYQELNNAVISYINLFNISEIENPFEQIKNAYKENLKYRKEIQELENKLNETKDLESLDQETIEKFKDKNIDDFMHEEKIVQKEIDKVNASIVNLNSKIGLLNNEIEEIDSLESELNYNREQKAEKSKEYKLIEQTKKYLTMANDSLTSKFIKPMYDGLTSNLSKITDEEFKVQVDTNLNVSLEYFSSLKELEQMSAGYKTIINLSMRLALIQAMFSKEKPFIVLDDPFVNLDEEKTEKALELIKGISKDYQIIYMVCHKSRI